MSSQEIESCGFEFRKDLSYWDSKGCFVCGTHSNFINKTLLEVYAKLNRSDEYYYILPRKEDYYVIGLLHFWNDDSANNRILFDGVIKTKTALLTLLEQIEVHE